MQHGIGKRKTSLQKSIETLESYLNRLKKYNQQIHICAERNSYSKTDHDATFMRMKEDAMGNGQLKPAYNLQHGVDSEYITWLTIGPQPTDTTTLIPFLKDAQEHLKFKYKNITADAGYESEENYLFLEANGQLSYIKPANYEISKTRKYKNDIGKIENMEYDVKKDIYTCRNGKKLGVDHIRHSKSKTGYVSEKTIYKCEDCNGCPYKSECIKGNNCKTPLEERTKTLQVAKTFLKHRKRRFRPDSLRRRDSLQDKPKYTGGRLLWRFKTGYAVPQIFKQRKCKCSCRKYVACHGKKHKQTA